LGGLAGLGEEFSEAGGVGGGGFGDEAAVVGEVDVVVLFQIGEVEEGGVVVAGEAVAFAAAVGVNHAEDGFVFAGGFDEAGEAQGGFIGEGIGARHEDDFEGSMRAVDGPEVGVVFDVFEAMVKGFEVDDEVFADEAHDFPEGIAGGEFGGGGEASKEGDVDGGVELVYDVAVDAEFLGGFDGTEAVEPFGGFEPIAEEAGVLVEADVLEDEAEGADGGMILGELVVIEIAAVGFVFAADIDDEGGGVVEVCLGRFASYDGSLVEVDEDGAGEEVIFMGAAGVGEDLVHGHGWGLMSQNGGGCLHFLCDDVRKF
jgi:hypothetical protein